MRTLIDQTRTACNSKLYYLALISALSIPDIAGALGSSDGRASGKKYANWYEEWVRGELKKKRNRDNPFSGEDCYTFRCSLIHQGSSQHTKSRFTNIMFIEPGHENYSIHYCTIGGRALLIQLDEFIEEVLSGGELWLSSVEKTETFRQNYSRFAKRHPMGLDPYVMGVPVIG